MFVKLFTSIYQGTLRGRANELLVFTNLLAHADAHGNVDIHPNAIADEVGLKPDQVKAALIELESVDPESRSPENDGRRILRLDGHRAWGWHIVNYVKYRAIRSEDERRMQNREAQARWRNKNKGESAEVSDVSQDKPMQKQKEKKIQSNTNTVAPPDGVALSVWQDFQKTRKTKVTETALNGIRREAERAGITLEAALNECCARGWQSFKADWVNKPQSTNETAYQRSKRELWEAATGRNSSNFITEVHDVAPFALGR